MIVGFAGKGLEYSCAPLCRNRSADLPIHSLIDFAILSITVSEEFDRGIAGIRIIIIQPRRHSKAYTIYLSL